jgi:hypothetical protein
VLWYSSWHSCFVFLYCVSNLAWRLGVSSEMFVIGWVPQDISCCRTSTRATLSFVWLQSRACFLATHLLWYSRCVPYFPAHKTYWPVRRAVIFLLEILEKNDDECILILVIYWKKTGLLHTKISNHNTIYSSSVHEADNLTTSACRMSWNLGA